MMQMIDKGGLPALTDRIREADDDNPKGYYEFEPVKKTKEDPSWLQQAEGKVVKMVHLLLMDLPLDREYRVVFMRRKLEEVVASQNVMLERSGKSTGNLSNERVIQIFKTQLQKVAAWLEEHPNFRVHQVNYNDLISEPAPVAQAVNEFLGGVLNTDAMVRAVDPSLYRQRR
ncbi:MAG: sulfotransferase [Phycisphaerales bacterium]|nr:MAG: sulfotransferase [Phycisphaerales bacterium]